MSDNEAGRIPVDIESIVRRGCESISKGDDHEAIANIILSYVRDGWPDSNPLSNEHEAGEGERVDTCPTCGSDDPARMQRGSWSTRRGVCPDPFHDPQHDCTEDEPDERGDAVERGDADLDHRCTFSFRGRKCSLFVGHDGPCAYSIPVPEASERAKIETWHGAKKESIPLWRRSPDHGRWAEIVGPASGHPDNEYIEVCPLTRALSAEAEVERLRGELEAARADYIGAVDAQVGALKELIEAEGDPLMKATARKRLNDLGTVYHAEGVAEIVKERDQARSELQGVRALLQDTIVARNLHATESDRLRGIVEALERVRDKLDVRSRRQINEALKATNHGHSARAQARGNENRETVERLDAALSPSPNPTASETADTEEEGER